MLALCLPAAQDDSGWYECTDSHQSFRKDSFNFSGIFPARYHFHGQSLRISGECVTPGKQVSSELIAQCIHSWYSSFIYLASDIKCYSHRSLVPVPSLVRIFSWIAIVFHWVVQVTSFLFLNYSKLNFLWLNNGIPLRWGFYWTVVLYFTVRSLRFIVA